MKIFRLLKYLLNLANPYSFIELLSLRYRFSKYKRKIEIGPGDKPFFKKNCTYVDKTPEVFSLNKDCEII